MAIILVVDDEPDIRLLTKVNLERDGHQILTAGDGNEALEAVKETPPDLILLDVMMPDVDGPATLERLRPLIGDAPVIFLTAKTQSSDLERLTSLGAVGVIAKPFDPMGLPEEVDALIGS